MFKTVTELLANAIVKASGFPALAALEKYSKGNVPVVLSSLPASVLSQQGIKEYYALQLPRGAVFKTADEIIEANLPVRKYFIYEVDADHLETIIATRHNGTAEILLEKYPHAPVLADVTPEQIAGKHIIGTLPPHLITEAAAYTSVTIKNFDYAKDGDLAGEELMQRLEIASAAIRLKEANA